MPELQHAKSFRDLIVHQKARALARRIFELSKSFPKEEAYSLTDQIRRASRSVGAQIAEAWGKRQYERHFVSKLTDADAEQLETQHWTDVAFDLRLFNGGATRFRIGQSLRNRKDVAFDDRKSQPILWSNGSLITDY